MSPTPPSAVRSARCAPAGGHCRRPRLPPRRGTAEAPSREQGHPGGAHGRSNSLIASPCHGRRCPPVSLLFASWPWLLHTGCSLQTIDMPVHERNYERRYSRSIPDHRIAVDPREATRLAYATALRDVVQHQDDLARFSLGAKERRALPLRKPCLTGPAVQQAQVLVLPVAHTDGQVASTTLAMIAALLIVTAKPRELVHCFPSICITQLANACPW